MEKPARPYDPAESRVPDSVMALDVRIRTCRRCQIDGYIPEARPVVTDGGRVGGIVLIGQAPGIVEHDNGRPFGGRAGRELFRWMNSIGIEEIAFRDRVYMAAMTRCFPGRNPSGGGDRKPSRPEIENCKPWLDAVLDCLQPRALLLVGTLAIERHLPRRRLEDLIGHQFEEDGRRLIPLPHPSGASRWLNDLAHRELLRTSLVLVRAAWDEFAGDGPVRHSGVTHQPSDSENQPAT